ncbi:MAG: hypothetical protein GXY67_07860 [Clostridiales bacterium]|nr:hypothetical protein [Clostridiales bacterium]
MAYDRIKWTDEAVERPNTWRETTNADGSITHTKSPGTVMQAGTPVNATNLNHIEEGLQHCGVAYDLLAVTTQMQIRAMQKEIATLQAAVAALA